MWALFPRRGVSRVGTPTPLAQKKFFRRTWETRPNLPLDQAKIQHMVQGDSNAMRQRRGKTDKNHHRKTSGRKKKMMKTFLLTMKNQLFMWWRIRKFYKNNRTRTFYSGRNIFAKSQSSSHIFWMIFPYHYGPQVFAMAFFWSKEYGWHWERQEDWTYGRW